LSVSADHASVPLRVPSVEETTMWRLVWCLIGALCSGVSALAEDPPPGSVTRVDMDQIYDESGERIDAATVMERVASGRYTLRTEVGPDGANRAIVSEITDPPDPAASEKPWTPGAPVGSRLSKGDLWPYASASTLADEEIAITAGTHPAIIIDFWFTHCAPCVAAMPKLNDLRKRYVDRDVLMLAPSFEDANTLSAFLARRDFQWPVVPLASDWFRSLFGGYSAPHYVLLDRELRVRLITNEVDKLERALEGLLGD
jgi:thiol-disulfide isomerase/thioredoxin